MGDNMKEEYFIVKQDKCKTCGQTVNSFTSYVKIGVSKRKHKVSKAVTAKHL